MHNHTADEHGVCQACGFSCPTDRDGWPLDDLANKPGRPNQPKTLRKITVEVIVNTDTPANEIHNAIREPASQAMQAIATALGSPTRYSGSSSFKQGPTEWDTACWWEQEAASNPHYANPSSEHYDPGAASNLRELLRKARAALKSYGCKS